MRCGNQEFIFGARTYVMGIINVTPDSFSDGGLYYSPDKAYERAMQLIEEGADVIDIGGESTRPQALPVCAEEELERILPVVKRLEKVNMRQISIDTRHALTAQVCLDAGASWINDVSAFSYDPKMVQVCRHADASILMHARGTPQNMQSQTQYTNVMSEVSSYLKERVEFAAESGISISKLIVDPGIGFAKEAKHDVEILGNMSAFSFDKIPVLAAMSRKKFIKAITGIENPQDRDVCTIAALSAAVLSGANIVRVHNVKWAKEALKIIDRIQATVYST